MNGRFSRSAVRLVLAFALVLCLAGCIVLPTSKPDPVDTSILEPHLQWIVPGRSVKSHIVDRFGVPLWMSPDDSQWKYEMRQYYPWGWSWCFVFGAAYYGGIECGDWERPLKAEILDIHFDDSGTVTEWETTIVKPDTCNEHRDCPYTQSVYEGVWPRKIWFVEDFQFDLVERQGLLYVAMASTPYTGRRTSYYPNGNKASECYFEMGLRHGPCEAWYANGEIYKAATFEIGEMQGQVTTWHVNGEKSGVITYLNGRRHGPITHWATNGEVITDACFRDGEFTDEPSGSCGVISNLR